MSKRKLENNNRKMLEFIKILDIIDK